MGLVFIACLFVSKLLIGLATGSIALVADAFSSLSDVLILAVAYLSLRVILKKPNSTFPYGYYKVEDTISLIMAAGFAALGSYIILYWIKHIQEGFAGSKHYIEAAATAFIVGVLSLIFGMKQGKAAKEAGITSLALSSRDLKLDAIAAFAVGVSIILNRFYAVALEGYASVGLGILIIITAIKGGTTAAINLLDACSRPELIKKIKDIINKHPPLRAGRVRLRRSGPLLYGDAIIYAPEEIRLEDLDDLLDEIEKERYAAIPDLQEIVFHVEPLEETSIFCAIPVDEGEDLNAKIASDFDKASKYLILAIDMKRKNVSVKRVVKNISLKDIYGGVKMCKKLVKEGVDCTITKSIGEASFELLKAYSIDTYITDRERVKDVIEDLLGEKIEPIDEYSQVLNILRKKTSEDEGEIEQRNTNNGHQYFSGSMMRN